MTIAVSDKAKDKLFELGLNREKFLRIGVRPGGCSGMQYAAVIDDDIETGDQVVYESGELRIVSDSSDIPYVDGLSVDYSDDLVKSGFRLINVNANKSCGCGTSFDMNGGCG